MIDKIYWAILLNIMLLSFIVLLFLSFFFQILKSYYNKNTTTIFSNKFIENPIKKIRDKQKEKEIQEDLSNYS